MPDNEPTPKTYPLTVDYSISTQRLADLMDNALDGADYWLGKCVSCGTVTVNMKIPPHTDPRYYDGADALFKLSVPLTDDDSEFEVRKLTRTDMIEGLRKLAHDFPEAFGRIMDESDDAVDADLWLQYALFKEVLYG